MSFRKVSRKLASFAFVAVLAVALPTMAYAQTEEEDYGIQTATYYIGEQTATIKVPSGSTVLNTDPVMKANSYSYATFSTSTKAVATYHVTCYLSGKDYIAIPHASNGVELRATSTVYKSSYLSDVDYTYGTWFCVNARLATGITGITLSLEYTVVP